MESYIFFHLFFIIFAVVLIYSWDKIHVPFTKQVKLRICVLLELLNKSCWVQTGHFLAFKKYKYFWMLTSTHTIVINIETVIVHLCCCKEQLFITIFWIWLFLLFTTQYFVNLVCYLRTLEFARQVLKRKKINHSTAM